MSADVSDVYAVIRSGGKQYRVSPGQTVRLERLDGEAGDRIDFDDVLLVNGDGRVAVGSPNVETATVRGEIVEQGRGRKVLVFKYKNKTRYRRLRGHRQLHTAVRVEEVQLGDQSWSARQANSDASGASEAPEESEPAAATSEATAESED